jgi:outer membrane protein assembly factor BamA
MLRPGLAQEPEGASIEPSLELAGDASSMVATASHLDLGMSATAGSSIRSLSDRWPEDLVIAPIPGRSPQLGWMLSLAGGYFLERKDEESAAKPSVIGGFGMASENGSYAYGGGANLHLLDDRLRIKAGAAYFDIRYRYYGTGVANDLGVGVELLQEAPLYFTEGTWRLWNQLYVGLGLLGGNVDTRPRIAIDESPFLAPSLNVDIAAWSLPIQYDSRDSETYPRRGWLVTGRAMNYRKSLGSDFDAETFKLAVNRYMTVRDRDVLAVRGMIRATNGDAPFFLQSTFGGKTDLRGYPSGRFRDRMMYALQGEYRWQVSDRWVFTGFAGFGEVADSFGDMGENVLPAAGMGARFILSTKHEVGLSADFAVGNDGAEFYFGVGEAF